MPPNKPPVPIITTFAGRSFNSPQQVALARDGSLWFTDSYSGFEADIRAHPSLPSQVYRYEPGTGSLRAVADGLERPNGICFNPNGETVYVTDTDAIRVNKDQSPVR
jgi:gluconolactonase